MNDDYLTIFAIMPKEIYRTKSLSPEDKLIAERIVYLCKQKGYCWITNKALADMYGIREDSVSQHIANLRKYGFIKCVYENSNQRKSNRAIFLTEDLWGLQPNSNRLNNHSTIGSITEHNINSNYKKKNKGIEPLWLKDQNICKSKEWDMSNPDDIKEYNELQELMKEFRGEVNE